MIDFFGPLIWLQFLSIYVFEGSFPLEPIYDLEHTIRHTILSHGSFWSFEIWISMANKVVQVLTKCKGHHHTGNDQLTPIKTSSSVMEVAKLMAWRQATSPLKIPTWSGGCQLLENVWRRHFTTWSGGNLQRWSCLPPSHQFDYFHHWGWCFYGCQLVIARMVVSLTFGQHLDHPIGHSTERRRRNTRMWMAPWVEYDVNIWTTEE